MKSSKRISKALATMLYLSLFQITTISSYGQSDDYNLKIGDLMMDFEVHVGYSYNDNVTSVAEDTPDIIDPTIIGPRSDWILSYGADIGLDWQITDNNTLGIILGLEYQDYQDLNYLDSENTFFSVDPESMVDFIVLVGPVEFKVYDQFGYSVDGSNSVYVEVEEDEGGEIGNDDGIPILRGRSIGTRVDRYAAWTNELGIEALAVLNPIELTLRFSRYDLMPDDNDSDDYVDPLEGTLSEDRWEFTRRTEYKLYGEAYYPMGSGSGMESETGVGIFAQLTSNDYKREVLADSTGFQIGLTADWALGERTALAGSIGWDSRSYDEDNTLRYISDNSYADITEGDNLFYSLSVLNLLGDNFNHKFTLAREVSYGRVINEQVSTMVSWDFLFEGLKRVDITGGVQWVTSEESGPEQYSEDYDLFMANLGFEVVISDNLRALLAFRHLNKDSNDNDRDFTQNTAGLSVIYDF